MMTPCQVVNLLVAKRLFRLPGTGGGGDPATPAPLLPERSDDGVCPHGDGQLGAL